MLRSQDYQSLRVGLGPAVLISVLEGQRSAVEDLDLLADADSLDLMEGWDGSFYEWAADQTDGGGQSAG